MADEAPVERRLAAILAGDVVGYSGLMGVDEVGTLRALKAIRRELADPAIAAHHGRVVKTTGDGILIEFGSVVDAVACAVTIQDGMVVRNAGVPEDKRIVFRIGINIGDIIIDEADIHGDGVNVAARLEGLAQPGGICVSRKVRDEVRDKLDVTFEDMGEQSLKNIARPVRAYRVSLVPAQSSGDGGPLQRPALPLPDKPSLAVLPFHNLSGDSDQEYFADGMVEEIITALSRFRQLFVIARNSSFTYKGRAVDVKQIGRELGVRYVLEGSVRKSGNRVRIIGQLIDASTGAHLWADRFDGELDDVFELQDQMTASVVGAITPRLEQAEIERARIKPTENLNAYDLYLRALPHYYAFTRTGNDEALGLLRRAIKLDPDYAVAKAFAAYCILQRANQGYTESQSQTEIDESIRLAREALDAGRDDPRVLPLAGTVLAVLAQDWETAIIALDRALSLNSNSAQVWRMSGWVRVSAGDLRTGAEHLSHAIHLSPRDPDITRALTGLGLANMMAGDYDEALKFGRQALQEMPRNVIAHRVVAASLALLGRTEEARKAMRALLAVAPNSTMSYMRKYIPYRDAEFVERYLRGLREAGLPE
ncbi:adenylate cyclase [Rhizobiales bacterium GAS191]|nr:adenylate cyclase [Rhizobiales bacterium GAS191]